MDIESRTGLRKPKFPWRITIYTVFVAYLALDLHLFKGPLHRFVRTKGPMKRANEQAELNSWAAVVNGIPITRDQLDHAVLRHYFLRGKKVAKPEGKAAVYTRLAVLDELIESQLIRRRAELAPVEVAEDIYAADWQRFLSQFPSQKNFTYRLKESGLTQEGIKARIRAETQEKAWIEDKIDQTIAATDEEVRVWYDSHQSDLKMPEMMRAKHIFLSTIPKAAPGQPTPADNTPTQSATIEKKRLLMMSIREQLMANATQFDALAAQHSDDARTAKQGGDLGYFSRKRISKDFAKGAFELDPGELSQPIRTPIGWHLVKVVEKKSARSCSFEELEEEIRLHIKNEKRPQAVKALLKELRRQAGDGIALYGPAWEVESPFLKEVS